jgi:hypothetical protein
MSLPAESFIVDLSRKSDEDEEPPKWLLPEGIEDLTIQLIRKWRLVSLNELNEADFA